VAGATGTGKTVTLQTLAEQLSAAGVSVFAADAPAPSGGTDALGDFLTSREGKAIQRKVLRGVFGMLRKRL
jgi:DNA helicase HerA-like ATPase